MLNQFLRYGLGVVVALACLSPAMAQQTGDPLTRFLDGVFKRPQSMPAQSREVPQPAQVQQTAPAAQAAKPASPRAQKETKKDTRKASQKKTAAPKKQASPQVAQPEPQPEPKPVQQAAEPKPEAKPVQQAQPQSHPAETEVTETKRPAEPEPSKSVESPAAQAAEQDKDKDTLATLAAEPPPASPPPPPEPVRAPAKAANVSPQQSASAPTPVAAKAQVTPTAPSIPNSPDAALDRVNAYFNGMDQMTAYFVQKNPNGQQAEGTLAVRRPGILQFAYAPPSTLEVVSDGRNVAIRDKRLGTNDVYPIGQTPLKFLLQEHVDLARDTKVRDVQVGREGMVTVRFDDSATLGGTSRITLRFDARANVLKQWTIVDGQGYETSVTLSDVNVVHRKDARAAN